MTTKQPLARIAIELLHVVHELAIAIERKSVRALRSAYRAANICSGCDSGMERCGPVLWSRGKMCCQHCSHVRTVNGGGESKVVQHGE